MINSINGYNNNTSFNGSIIFHRGADTANNFMYKCLGFCNKVETMDKIKILSVENISTNTFNVKCADKFNNKFFKLAEKFAEKNGYTFDKIV